MNIFRSSSWICHRSSHKNLSRSFISPPPWIHLGFFSWEYFISSYQKFSSIFIFFWEFIQFYYLESLLKLLPLAPSDVFRKFLQGSSQKIFQHTKEFRNEIPWEHQQGPSKIPQIVPPEIISGISVPSEFHWNTSFKQCFWIPCTESLSVKLSKEFPVTKC